MAATAIENLRPALHLKMEKKLGFARKFKSAAARKERKE
jgi:hypothetical protein